MWYKIYERGSDGRIGTCVFDCRAESIEDAYNQVSRQSWPFGLHIAGGDESRSFAGNNPKRAATLEPHLCPPAWGIQQEG